MVLELQNLSVDREEDDGTTRDQLEHEGVVISGMAGLYPNSHHVKDLANILYNKIDPVTTCDTRWVFKHPELADYTGKVPDLNNFDGNFFKVHYYLGIHMNVINRKMFEQAYAAIYDAGVNPNDLSGKNVGVFVGVSLVEKENISAFKNAWTVSAFALLGASRAMFANRISYWLNVKGPSVTVDEACCGSTAALELAYKAIMQGECEAAIVGAANLCLHPITLIHYGRCVKLSNDGKTRSFDENASGTVISEALNVLFLQKAKDCLRVYADLVHVKSDFISIANDEMGIPRYGFYRNTNDTVKFLKRFYEETNVPPQAVEYVEGFGSAIPETDKVELDAYDEVYCRDRNDPLLVGSVTSNLGNMISAMGISAITKILLGYNTGVLAGNLNYENPRHDIMAIRDRRITIVNENMPFGSGYAAVNGFSVFGINCHVLLKGRAKSKDPARYKSPIPHLVFLSARQEIGIIRIFNNLKSRPVDPEEIALLNNAHGTRISGHLGRGFTILDTNNENKTVSLCEKVDNFDYVKRPIWFVYSGMGSQHVGMGVDLMRIPVFAAAIHKCQRVLEPKGIDLIHIITSPDKAIFKNILNSFVGIAAIQIGLTDMLRELGIVPDKIIGHSVGELGCAYADGCFTAEEMILSAYSRGLVSVETSFIRGAMAAVGLGYKQVISMCPPEIEVACHNSSESCTISGPAELMDEFVTTLAQKNIFAREVPCSNIAYHSRYIAHAGPGLLKYLREIIKTPRTRSERWVSTSIPMDKWNEPSAKYSSAEYHTNNLLNPVLFEETSRLIPSNAIVVEIAPHGLLQSILKRSLPLSCTNVPLTRRGCQDNVVFFLEAIGNLYLQGLNPKIETLYPKIEFPVSTGTPMLSHLVEWAHPDKWNLPLYTLPTMIFATSTTNIITLHDEEHKYLKNHVVGGKILYPFSATLVAVWDTLAITLGVARRQLAVQFHEVMLHVQPILHDRRCLRLMVTLQRGNGRFEVLDDMKSIIATGIITAERNERKISQENKDNQSTIISSEEIYEHFLYRGFSYRDCFKSICDTNISLTEARIQWRGNWVTFLDGILQLNNLRHSLDSYSHPSYITKLSIDPNEQDDNEDDYTAVVFESYNLTKCGGILMENVNFNDQPTPPGNKTKLRSLKFVPHFSLDQFDFETILQVYLQIVAENVDTRQINVLGVYDNQKTLSKLNEIKCIMRAVPEISTECKWVNRDSILKQQRNTFAEVNLLLILDLATDDYMCHMLHEVVKSNTFIINIRDSINNMTAVTRPSSLYQVVCDHSTQSSLALELSRWRPTNRTTFKSVLSVYSSSEFPLLIHEINSLLPHEKLLVVTPYPTIPGLKGLLDQYKNESCSNIYLVMSDNEARIFDDDAVINADLAVKVIRNGVFGGEYYVPLDDNYTAKGDVQLNSSVIGQFQSLKWTQTHTHQDSGILVKVHYAAINDIDSKRFSGAIPFDSKYKGYGMDFSGVNGSGARVMGLVKSGAVGSVIEAQPELLWPVPSHWSLEDAATVPLAYCLAYYCIAIKTKLYPGIKVLVHGGAGALGQAVISLTLANGCEVFATVSDQRKKKFLLKMYPDLKAENIGNSRDSSFFDVVLTATNGKGVDIVISTVNGTHKQISLKCVGYQGILLDMSQIPNRDNFYYTMSNLWQSRSYMTVDFFSIFNDKEQMMKLQRMISEGIVKGWVRPLSRVVYGPGDVSRAFKLLASRNQRGRVLVNLQQTKNELPAQPRLQCSSDKFQLIVSDNEAFGQRIADMLINRGARKIYLNLASSHENCKLKIRQWQEQGIKVICEYSSPFGSPELLSENWTNIPGDVEGIYIIFTDDNNSCSNTETIVETIDEVSRKAIPNLRYFAVINIADSAGENTCLSRKKDNLTATMLKLPGLKEIGKMDTQKQVSMQEAVKLVERAIISNESVLSADVVFVPQSSLLEDISTITGLNVTQDIGTTKTLSDLGVDTLKAESIHLYLRNTYKVFLTTDEIQTLTVERINSMYDTITNTSFGKDKGLIQLFTRVHPDEIVAVTEMLFMPTLTSDATWSENQFDVKSPYLCIIPGLEGNCARFRMLCARLKIAAMVLQPDLSCPHETIPDMANRFAELLSKTANPKQHFYLVGYETGVFIVLEMAAVLEKNGYTTTVFCIGNPDKIITEIKDHVRGMDTEELQNAILQHMFGMVTNSGIDELERALYGVSSWPEKLDVTIRTMTGKVSHSLQYMRQLILAAYERTVSILRYKMKVHSLQSQLILLQSSSNGLQRDNIQKHSQLPVVRYELQAPLSQALDDLRCAAIVNSHLDEKIMAEYEKNNLCDTYLLYDGDLWL